MRDTLISWGVDPELAIAEGDAVDLRRFADLPPMPEARKQFTVKTERMVVGYVGRLKTLGMDKGVAVLLQALKALQPGKQFFGFIVGGPEGDRKEYEEMAKGLGLKVGLGVDADVGFIGEIPAAKVPASLAACDILAMPFPDFPHYRHHMSPLKMFEYMAANRTIVTTELPTVRDVLSEETAIFCKPGSVAGLAASLEWIRDHQKEARERAQKAYALVHTYTWEKRMQRILDNVPATVGA